MIGTFRQKALVLLTGLCFAALIPSILQSWGRRGSLEELKVGATPRGGGDNGVETTGEGEKGSTAEPLEGEKGEPPASPSPSLSLSLPSGESALHVAGQSPEGKGTPTRTPFEAPPSLPLLRADNLRGAICLVGGAREFELTGPSIRKHLLGAFKNADVFVNMGLDENSYKLMMFRKVPNLAKVRIFPQSPISVGPEVRAVSAVNSPNGIQGILQYFNLVEGCLDLIDSYSLMHSVKYEWIIRTRVDSFWTGPPPPLFLQEGIYVVPKGSRFGGLNDRFGFGNYNVSQIALSRLTMLDELRKAGMSRLNSEKAFRGQLSVRKIKASLQEFDFCIVSRRTYSWFAKDRLVPTVAMSSKGPMNGAKCRPCTPLVYAGKSKEFLKQCSWDWGWPGGNPNLELCYAQGPWEEGWEVIFDRIVGTELAAERKETKVQTLDDCIEKFDMLRRVSGMYEGPSGRVVCRLSELGPFKVLAKRVPIYMSQLVKSSIVYSFEFSRNWSVELQIYSLTECSIYLFQNDFSKVAMIQETPAVFKNGVVWDVEKRERAESAALPLPPPMAKRFETLNSAMAALGHETVDLLMLRVTEDSLPAAMSMLSGWKGKERGSTEGEGEGEGGGEEEGVERGREAPVCQIVVRLEMGVNGTVRSEVSSVREVLEEVGLFLVHCRGRFGGETCVFVRGRPCRN